jgi:ATP-dependent DNA helicase PIF1
MNLSDALNTEQQAAYNAIAEGRNVFLTGPGGTGKSFLLGKLHDDLPRDTGRKVSLTAMTGCAALLLHSKAKTLHSWAGIGLGTDSVPVLIGAIRKSRKAALRWLTTDTLVIDEVSMMTPELFEKLDQIGRKMRRQEARPFGGLQVVLVGDFYQLPPVTRTPLSHNPDEPDPETNFVFESPLWKQIGLQKHELTQIVRQKDPVFQQILNEARRGQVTKASAKILHTRMGLDTKSLEIQPTMLFTRRAQVDSINLSHLKQLTTEKRTFQATTLFNPTASTEALTEQDPLVARAIAKLDQDAPYVPELTLAVGAQVMMLKNMPELGLVNGSRGVVTKFTLSADSPVAVPVVKFRNGLEIPMEYTTWELPDFKGVFRRQIPLRLAYAITIHKAQGATLDCALIDIGGRTFEYGQAYVALSRVRDLESLYIHDFEKTAFRAHPKVAAFYAAT